jgi:hypothetical protein
MKYQRLARILALDVHPRSFGYVVVETPDKLLHWGVRSCRTRGNPNEALVRRELMPLLQLWQPSVLVVQGFTTSSRSGRLLLRLVKEAKNHRLRVRISPKRAGGLTKHENARLLTEQFPILAWDLPSKRKPWESEHYRMSMFSAAALAMTYRSLRYGTVTSPPGGVMPKFTQRRRS